MAMQKRWEKDMIAFSEAKSSNKRLFELKKSFLEKETKIKNLVKQKNIMLKVEKEAYKNVLQKASGMKSCLKEKSGRTVEKVSEKVFRSMIKRKGDAQKKFLNCRN